MLETGTGVGKGRRSRRTAGEISSELRFDLSSPRELVPPFTTNFCCVLGDGSWGLGR
jgi:hypothetical protein